jgi:hypothetical protein
LPAVISRRLERWKNGGAESLKSAAPLIANTTCDNAALTTVVVLHLRARYVSKAAILTLPIRYVSVENRSPA